MADLGEYIKRLQGLNVYRGGGRPSPHKMCMLLAVIDLFDANPNRPNRLEYEPQLLDRFHGFFNTLRGPDDQPRPYYPFFFLKNDGFWHLHPVPGREAALDGMEKISTVRQLNENVALATLDDDLHSLLKEEEARNALAETIVQHWFDRSASDLWEMLRQGREINRYEQQLRNMEPVEITEIPPAYIRDPAFRRVVLQAYDYRCAASGARIILPDESVMVQAAHIEPFSEAGNDDPRNGLALTPDMHWAMDKHIIAPGPDYRWHVSRQMDRRIKENESFYHLEGMKLLLPDEQRYWPKEEYLHWRKARLM